MSPFVHVCLDTTKKKQLTNWLRRVVNPLVNVSNCKFLPALDLNHKPLESKLDVIHTDWATRYVISLFSWRIQPSSPDIGFQMITSAIAGLDAAALGFRVCCHTHWALRSLASLLSWREYPSTPGIAFSKNNFNHCGRWTTNLWTQSHFTYELSYRADS